MITVDAAQIERAERELAAIPGAASRAVARALNRSAASGRAAAIEKIRERYAIRAGDVRDKIALTTATPEQLEVAVRATSPSISVTRFPHSPKRAGTGGPGRPPLRAEVIRGQKRAVADERGPVFVATINGNPRVMRRIPGKKTANGRSVIESVYTVPIAVMMGAASVREAVEVRALQMFDQRLSHEIDRELGGTP